jgi:hypothetical protein
MEVSRINSLQRWRLRGIYIPFEKLVVGEYQTCPVTIPDTSVITRTAPTVTKLVTLRDAGTSDDCRNFRLPELSTNQTENTEKVVVAGQIPDTSGINTVLPDSAKTC